MGDVYVDEIGDRIADYSLLDMTDRINGTFKVRDTLQTGIFL